MKAVLAIAAVSAFVSPVFAQQHPVQQQGSPTQPVQIQMVCRDMSTTGEFLGPNETMIGDKACHPVNVERLGNGTGAQPANKSNAPVPAAAPATSGAPATAAAAAPAAAKMATQTFAMSDIPVASNQNTDTIRVFVTDSESWSGHSGWAGTAPTAAQPAAPSASAANSKEAAKAEALTASAVDKLVTEVNRQCPEVMVTSDMSRAAFAVTLDHTEKNRFSQSNKVVVFNHTGDDIYSGETRGLGDSIGEACKAILASAKK